MNCAAPNIRLIGCALLLMGAPFGWAEESSSPKIDTVVKAYFPDEAQGGLAVLAIRDGKVIHKKGYGVKNGKEAITPDTKMGLASITKAFTAMCAALLIDEGKLKLTDKVSTHLPDLHLPTKGRELLVEDLIWHTNGLVNFIKKEERNTIAKYKEDRALPYLNNLTHAEWLAKQPLIRAPGVEHEYTNSGYVLLAHLIEVIAKQPYHEFQQERIFDKLGMSDTSDSKRFNGSGNIVTTLSDYEKWDRELWNPSLLDEETTKLIFSPGKLDNGDRVDYGFGWKLTFDPDGKLIEVHHGGSGSPPANSRNFVLRDLRNRITVAFFGRENLTLTRDVRSLFAAEIRDAILEANSN